VNGSGHLGGGKVVRGAQAFQIFADDEEVQVFFGYRIDHV
jgi:hypothetical protein